MTAGERTEGPIPENSCGPVLRVVTLGSRTGRYGGPFSTGTAQVQTLNSHGINASLLYGVMTGDEPTPPANVRAVTVRVRRILPGPEFPMLFSLKMLRQICREVRAASTLHVSLGRELIPVTAALIAITLRRKLVVQTHGMLERDSRLHLRILDVLVMRRIVRRANLVVVLTDAEHRQLNAWLGRSIPDFIILGNGVDTAALPNYLPRPCPDTEILFMARFHRRKCVVDFAEAARFSSLQGSEARYVAVGPDGGQLDRVQRAAAASGGLEIQPPVPPTEIATRLVSARIFVQSSFNEPWGNVLVTALSLGIPSIVTRSAALASLMEEYDGGVIVPDGCPSAIASAVDLILADPELWNRLSSGALRLSHDHFDLKPMGVRLVEAYASLSQNDRHHHGSFVPRMPGR